MRATRLVVGWLRSDVSDAMVLDDGSEQRQAAVNAAAGAEMLLTELCGVETVKLLAKVQALMDRSEAAHLRHRDEIMHGDLPETNSRQERVGFRIGCAIAASRGQEALEKLRRLSSLVRMARRVVKTARNALHGGASCHAVLAMVRASIGRVRGLRNAVERARELAGAAEVEGEGAAERLGRLGALGWEAVQAERVRLVVQAARGAARLYRRSRTYPVGSAR